MGLRERITFLGQLRADFEHTGAVQPSSRFLARAMAAPVREAHADERSRGLRILEIGPGTGAVTRAIAAAMGPADELVCYEINATFVSYLEEALRTDSVLRPVADRVTIHNAPAQNLDAGEPFDVAVCSAPLNNFDAETIDAILAAIMGALADGGRATLFEYAVFPAIRRAATRGDDSKKLRDAEQTKSRWLGEYGCGSVMVLRNIPPARVHELSR